MIPVVKIFLANWLIRVAKKVNKGAVHKFAAECVKADVEAGYESYKDDPRNVLSDGGSKPDWMRHDEAYRKGDSH